MRNIIPIYMKQSRYFASQALSRICEATGLEGWNLIGADGAQAGVAGVSDTTVCHLLPLVVPSKLPSSSPSLATVATKTAGWLPKTMSIVY